MTHWKASEWVEEVVCTQSLNIRQSGQGRKKTTCWPISFQHLQTNITPKSWFFYQSAFFQTCSFFSFFRCVLASLWEGLSVPLSMCPSVTPFPKIPLSISNISTTTQNHFWMRTRISIRGYVRPSVCPSVTPFPNIPLIITNPSTTTPNHF